MNDQDHRPIGWIFLIVLFFATCWPDKSYGAVEVGNAVFYISELSVLFLPIAYLLYPRRNSVIASSGLRISIIIFFVTLCFVGFTKCAFLSEQPIGFLRDLRHILPLLSGLSLIFLGMRIRADGVWLTILLGLSCSYILSILFFVLDVDPIFISTKEVEIEVASMVKGRLRNMNSGLSMLFLCVLIAWKKNQQYKEYFVWVLIVSSLSLAVSLLSFNRTLLVMYPVVLLGFLFFHFDIRKAICIAALVGVSAAGIFFIYGSNDAVRRQVDHRILSLQYGADALLETGFYGTRDVLYGGYVDLAADYWFVGAPYYVPKSYAKPVGGETRPVFVTDISIATIFLKFGVLQLLAFIWVIWRMLAEALAMHRRLRCAPPGARSFVNAFMMALVIYLPISLNLDVLARQQPIFFLSILLTFSVLNAPRVSGGVRRN